MATLDSVTANLLIEASIQAYAAYDKKHPATCNRDAVKCPAGYHVAGTFTGVDSAFFGLDNEVECFGVVFASDGHGPRSCIFAFRGTDTAIDAFVEMSLATGAFVPYQQAPIADAQVASAFWGIYTNTTANTPSMQSQVFSLLEELQPISELYITGHSLGAALAELFTLDLALSPFRSIPYLNRNYAAPRVGHPGFAKLYDSQPAEQDPSTKTIRVQNTYDLVPCVPTEANGFTHVGDAFLLAFFNKNWHWWDLPGAKYDAHSALNYKGVLECAFANRGECQNADLYVPATKEHLVSKTPDPATVCEVSWDWLAAEAEAAGGGRSPPPG